MTNGEKLYQKICEECGVDSLSDEELYRLILLFQERLGKLGDAPDIGAGQAVNLDADVS